MEKPIFVVGHKNPDTDSICSAICYAQLKNQLTNSTRYVPKRAGEINQETKYILDRFDVKEPEYLDDVSPQVRDIDIREEPRVTDNISLKNAWYIMKSMDVVTLPIVEKESLKGLITISDIANSYMEIYDNSIIAKAKTPYINIIETLDGELITGDSDHIYDSGKVFVAAANPELLEEYITPGDLVLLGNRYETQLCAIEMGAACLVVCEGAKVSLTIQKIASEHHCTVISTPHDTYMAARLINQSMPIRYFMRSDDLITFSPDSLVDDIKHTMASVRHRDFPVISKNGRYLGMISRRNLLGMERKKVILVDHNERTQAVDGISEADILEIIDHHRLGSLETMSPVFFRNQPLGCTGTIIYQMYQEAGLEIPKKVAALLCSAIVSDTLMFRSPTCTVIDQKAAEDMAKIAGIDITELATGMFTAGSDFSHKTDEEIFYQDYKQFSGVHPFSVGQISSMSRDELQIIKGRLMSYMDKIYDRKNEDMIFFMLTNVLDTSSELLYYGSGAEHLVNQAFGVTGQNHCAYVKGLVSRKKQLVPELMNAMNEK